METRIIEQVRIYILILNPMSGKAEYGGIAAISTDYDKLVEFYCNQKASETYRDGIFYKCFKKDGPLEYFNPCNSLELNDLGLFGHGIKDEWISIEKWNRIISENAYNIIN